MLRRMELRRENVCNSPLFVNDVRYPSGNNPQRRRNSIQLSNSVISIAQQGIWQLMVICKFLMRLHALGAYADNFSAQFVEGFIGIPESLRFSGTHPRLIHRIKEKDNVLFSKKLC